MSDGVWALRLFVGALCVLGVLIILGLMWIVDSAGLPSWLEGLLGLVLVGFLWPALRAAKRFLWPFDSAENPASEREP